MKGILSYNEVVTKEGFNLQRGMNYRPKDKKYSIFLMSVRDNSPYNDGFDEKGELLIYEGEDATKKETQDSKNIDQPLFTKNGKLTGNGKFFQAAEDYKYGRRKNAELVKVYEKISNNVWGDKGWFDLIDVKFQHSKIENRDVFKFILRPRSAEAKSPEELEEIEFSRRIPTAIKREVWERDKGNCIECGSDKNLHFDHIIPWAKGGSSIESKNIQILCGKHNLQKSDKIK